MRSMIRELILLTIKTMFMRKTITILILLPALLLFAVSTTAANPVDNNNDGEIVVKHPVCIKNQLPRVVDASVTILPMPAGKAFLCAPTVFSYVVVIHRSCKQKIDFNNLNAEMNQSQEDMSRMDPALAAEDQKNRKAAEEILKAGTRF
jgi:hypothetical protein